MKLVITINDDLYDDYLKQGATLPKYGTAINSLYESLWNGVPLPEYHGRLIDADAFERRCMFDSNIEDMQDVIYALRDYKSIIEADKEGNADGK